MRAELLRFRSLDFPGVGDQHRFGRLLDGTPLELEANKPVPALQ